MESIELFEAVLCESCRRITRRTTRYCTACGKPTLIDLSGLLVSTEPDGLLLEVEQSVWLQRLAKSVEIC
jgi:RNA polymerase subunit RPABC4/transcription elongation factor Spt4